MAMATNCVSTVTLIRFAVTNLFSVRWIFTTLMINFVMAHVLLLTDTQLERICERSEGLCGNDCMRCEAFQANLRYNDGYRESDFDDDDEYS